MAVQIQVRRDTAANWTSNDPTLASGEIGLETNTGKVKFGDGSTAWTALDYIASAISHDSLVDVSADDHHAQSHNISSHSDTTATGAELETLTDGSETALHSHGSAGIVVQVVRYDTNSCVASLTTIPFDDTIPQNDEGYEFMTCAITPTNASNKLKIDVIFNVESDYAMLTLALFQDSTADAINASGAWPGHDTWNICTLSHYMTAGTTSETTFKLRAGSTQSTFTCMNGRGDATRKYGGVAISSITITEIAV